MLHFASEFRAVISAIVISVATILWTLVSVVYGGIKDDMKNTNDRIVALDSSYREAVTSGLKVQDLIAKSPTLEKTISETHDAVNKIQGGLEMLNQKVDANEERNRIHLDNIQKQIHSIPGVTK